MFTGLPKVKVGKKNPFKICFAWNATFFWERSKTIEIDLAIQKACWLKTVEFGVWGVFCFHHFLRTLVTNWALTFTGLLFHIYVGSQKVRTLVFDHCQCCQCAVTLWHSLIVICSNFCEVAFYFDLKAPVLKSIILFCLYVDASGLPVVCLLSPPIGPITPSLYILINVINVSIHSCLDMPYLWFRTQKSLLVF